MENNDIELIEKHITTIYKLHGKALRNKGKNRTVSDARSILFYILHNKYGISYYKLSKIYNRNHSSIIRLVRKCEGLLKYDSDFRHKYNMCSNTINFPR